MWTGPNPLADGGRRVGQRGAEHANPDHAAGQQLKFIDTNAGDSFWVQDMTTPTQPNATITIADSGPTTDRWGLAAVEVPPAG
jgi:hypothetical protein